MMNDQVVARDWQLNIDADLVLRGQGADPVVIRQRRPRLLEIAGRAVVAGSALIDPVAVYRTLPVIDVKHQHLTLAGGAQLTGSLLIDQLAPAQSIAVIVCTIGSRLDERISTLMANDPALALALDGFGSVATEALGAAVCHRLEEDAAQWRQCASVPLNPGMIGWPVDVGQPQIFSLLDTDAIGVTLNDSAQMIPRKSASIVLGFAPTPFTPGRACDFCALRNTCRYQTRGAHS
jgi:hypothetical protein